MALCCARLDKQYNCRVFGAGRVTLALLARRLVFVLPPPPLPTKQRSFHCTK